MPILMPQGSYLQNLHIKDNIQQIFSLLHFAQIPLLINQQILFIEE
jgi:hypothetical protein